MLTGIDHIAIAVRDLDAAVGELRERAGIEAGGGGIHPGAGTANRLAWFGDTYLELISVADRTVAVAGFLGGPTVRVLDEDGGGFVTFVLASDDLDADVARLRAAGSTMGEPFPGERRRPDGRVVRWRLARAGAVGPDLPPFLIEHDTTAAEWTAAEREARAADTHPVGGTLRLSELSLTVADPPAVARGYLEAVGLAADATPGAGIVFSIGSQRVVLDAAHPVASAAPRTVLRLVSDGGRPVSADLFGCRFEISPAHAPAADERGGSGLQRTVSSSPTATRPGRSTSP